MNKTRNLGLDRSREIHLIDHKLKIIIWSRVAYTPTFCPDSLTGKRVAHVDRLAANLLSPVYGMYVLFQLQLSHFLLRPDD